MSFFNLVSDVDDLVQSFLHTLEEVKADQLGLDSRAGYSLFVNNECIAVSKHSDGSLRYYGGFEYIDSEYRTELADVVFYSAEADRVADCIEFFKESREEIA